jgi:hypothetical protein
MFDIRLSESSRRRSLTTSGSRNPATDGPNFGRNIVGFRPSRQDLAKTAGYDRIRPLIRKIPAESGQTFSPEFGNGDRTLPDSGDICQTLIFHFVIFSYEPNTEKYFRENHFFLKMISTKSFYDGNHFNASFNYLGLNCV